MLMYVNEVLGLEIRHLTALRAVADEGSFIGAADILGYSQAAISQQIAALERAIGQPAFDRPGGPRPVRLTPAGRILLKHACTILDQLAQADRDLSDLVSGTRGRLTVGTFQSVSVQLLPEIVAAVRASSPEVGIHAFELDENDHLIERLLDGAIDVTFLAGPVTDTRVAITELGSDPYVALLPKDSALGKRGSTLPTQLLRGMPMIGQHATEQQRHVERGLRAAGVSPNYVFVTHDNGAVQAMVRAGLGAAVMPQLAVDTRDPEVIVARLNPPIAPRTILLAEPQGATSSPATRQFARVAKGLCRKRLAQPPRRPVGQKVVTRKAAQ